MKNFLIVILMITWGGTAMGQQLLDTLVVDFQALDKEVQRCIAQYGADQVLVALDIDNTMLKSDTDLGSDIWYQWQSGSLPVKPTPSQQLDQDCMFKEAIGLLDQVSTMSPVDPSIPSIIAGWQKSGVTVMALTARGPDTRAATERELKRNQIDLSLTAPGTVEGNTMLLSYELSRSLSYDKGICMTSGMNKGEMLQHFLGRSGKTYKAIVFGDDTRKNIDAMKQAYSGQTDVYVALYHYDQVKQDRLDQNGGVLLTQEQADVMANDWTTLISTLATLFPERANKADCR